MQISLKSDALNVLASYSRLEPYGIQEDVLQYVLKHHKNNKEYSAVETKTKLLNLFYSTSINAVNLMAKHIFEIDRIDDRLQKGDKTLVAEIANLHLSDGSTRNNYSFATKFCAYHQPKKYPIFDSIVEAVFISLFENGKIKGYQYTRKKTHDEKSFSTTGFRAKLKEYSFYVEVYDAFMAQYDLKSFSYRQVDSYLWGAYKIGGAEYQIEKLAPIDKSKIIQM